MKLGSLKAAERHLHDALGLPPPTKQPQRATVLDWTKDAVATGGHSAPIAVPSGDVPTMSRESIDALWAPVRQALCDLSNGPSPTAAMIDAAFASCGFARKKTKDDGRVTYAHDDLRVRLDPFEIADALAFDVELDAPGHELDADAILYRGEVIDPELWKPLKTRYAEEVERFAKALDKRGDDALPTDLDALKSFMAAGDTKADKHKDATKDAELDALQAQVIALLADAEAKGTAPKGVIIYMAGPDGAGKTSTGGIASEPFEAAGFAPRTEVFKAPTPAERKQHWLRRFARGFPKPGEIVFWDRGPAGDSVYGPADDLKTRTMAREFSKLQGKLEADGVLMINVELFADQGKQASTFGKRLARQAIAARIGRTLEARGELTDDAKDGLAAIGAKIDGDDFRAFVAYPEVQAKFARFVAATPKDTPWLMLDATKRHDARLTLLGHVHSRI